MLKASYLGNRMGGRTLYIMLDHVHQRSASLSNFLETEIWRTECLYLHNQPIGTLSTVRSISSQQTGSILGRQRAPTCFGHVSTNRQRPRSMALAVLKDMVKPICSTCRGCQMYRSTVQCSRNQQKQHSLHWDNILLILGWGQKIDRRILLLPCTSACIQRCPQQ